MHDRQNTPLGLHSASMRNTVLGGWVGCALLGGLLVQRCLETISSPRLRWGLLIWPGYLLVYNRNSLQISTLLIWAGLAF